MKAAIIAGCVVLSVLCAAPGAHAAEKWRIGKSCTIERNVTSEESAALDDQNRYMRLEAALGLMTIGPEDLPVIEPLIKAVKKCMAFEKCIEDREAGKVKHCYENDKRWR